MSNEQDTSDKPAETPNNAGDSAPPPSAAPKQRKIVRRSGSTLEAATFTTELVGGPAAEVAAPSEKVPMTTPTGQAPEGAKAITPKVEGAAKIEGAPKADAPASAGPRRFDARAPRPRSDSPGPSRRRRPSFGDERAPGPRPVGMRPAPGGPRYPAPERPRRDREDAPPAARPAGMRPVPGGPRYPAPERPQRDRDDRPRDSRPRDDRPRDSRPAAEPRAAKPQVAKPVVPPPPPSAPAAKAKPQPVVIPLGPMPRAAQAPSHKPARTAKELLSQKAKQAQAHKAQPKPATKDEAPKAATTFDAAALGASWEDAKGALDAAGENGAALVDAWLAANNAAAIAAASEDESVAGAARKAAKRAIGVLKARGVTLPSKPKIVRAVDDRATVSIEATLLAPDSSGTIAIAITSKDTAGRYHIAEVIVREPIGILQAGAGWLSGSQLKEGQKRAHDGLGFAPVPVPLEYARWRVAEAKKLNAQSGQILPLKFEACRELVEPAPADAPPSPIADLESAATSERAQTAVPASSALHNEPEFRSWIPDRGALEEMLAKVGERLGPEGVRDQEKVNSTIKEEMDAATDRFFSPEVRNVVASRMKDAAISLRARKGDERATDALAVAHAIREAGLITSPPREIPFLVMFFQKGLAFLASQANGQVRIPVAPAAT